MTNPIIIQLRPVVARSEHGAVLGGAVADVVASVTDEQVIGPHTQPIVAAVKNTLARDQRAHSKLVGSLMGVPSLAVTAKASVSTGGRALPLPAVPPRAAGPEMGGEFLVCQVLRHMLNTTPMTKG